MSESRSIPSTGEKWLRAQVYRPQNITYYKGYAIVRMGPNNYDLWGPRGARTKSTLSGRRFIGSFIILGHAKHHVDLTLKG